MLRLLIVIIFAYLIATNQTVRNHLVGGLRGMADYVEDIR